MEAKQTFPNWIFYLIIFVGLWSLSKEFSRHVQVTTNLLVALIYPLVLGLILTFCKFFKFTIGKSNYFFNVSLSIILFFTFILLVNYRSSIEGIGHLLGRDFSIRTDYADTTYDESGPSAPDLIISDSPDASTYYHISYTVFVIGLLYFTLLGCYFSRRIMFWSDLNKSRQRDQLLKMLSEFSRADENNK